MKPGDIGRLYEATRGDDDRIGTEKTPLRRRATKVPEKVDGVPSGRRWLGRYGQPCPRCGTKVQRSRYLPPMKKPTTARILDRGKLLADSGALSGSCARLAAVTDEMEERSLRK